MALCAQNNVATTIHRLVCRISKCVYPQNSRDSWVHAKIQTQFLCRDFSETKQWKLILLHFVNKIDPSPTELLNM